MKPSAVQELTETRSVKRANELLLTGWQLLEINVTSRGPIYILGARTTTQESAAALPAKSAAALPAP